jgi:hypothetical protein
MDKVLKFSDFRSKSDIIDVIQNKIDSTDSLSDELLKSLRTIAKKFDLDFSKMKKIGGGIEFLLPKIKSFISEMNIKVVPTNMDYTLLTLTTISIILLDAKKTPPMTSDDLKNKLNPEIQLKFGNPRTLYKKIRDYLSSPNQESKIGKHKLIQEQ